MKRFFMVMLIVGFLFLSTGCSKKTASESCPISSGSVSCGATSGTVAP